MLGLGETGVNMRAEWDLVLEKVTSHHDHNGLIDLFELLLTEDERSAIASRLKVFQSLLDGEMSQRQIAHEYQISIATITRCSNYLKQMSIEKKNKIKSLIL